MPPADLWLTESLKALIAAMGGWAPLPAPPPERTPA